ncbi:Protein YIPF5 [Hondaea fermentalgiana]|uniref:Protein YIPF5 n=1 Tax=Hondaea fermentalgiana TaxID=2315210 RepID=A0A2R5GPV8_9STRA|nr:Protein YIPF5 [Hondaea fermentalgiana]|eukprot:GBG32912.1 Protein YIPF5 [Hondaea fermentalgiana]
MTRLADSATWWRAARASGERLEERLRVAAESGIKLALRLRADFEEEWRSRPGSGNGSTTSSAAHVDVEGGAGRTLEGGANDAPLADELGVNLDLVWRRLQLVATLGFRTTRKDHQALHQVSDAVGGFMCVVTSWIVLTALSIAFGSSHATPLLGASILTWLLGSAFVWVMVVGLSGGTGASKDALQCVLTAVGYSSLALCVFLVVGGMLEALTGFAWLGALFRLCGVILASRCVGIWILRIHKMLHKQVLVVYPIVLVYSQLL